MASVTLTQLLDALSACGHGCKVVQRALRDLAKESDSMDDATKALRTDVGSLGVVSKDLSSTLQKAHGLDLPDAAKEQEIRSTLHSSIMSCGAHLAAVSKLLDEIRGTESIDGWISSTMRACRLGVSQDELSNHCIEIQACVADFETAIETVNL